MSAPDPYQRVRALGADRQTTFAEVGLIPGLRGENQSSVYGRIDRGLCIELSGSRALASTGPCVQKELLKS
jgi:hypothetical protein